MSASKFQVPEQINGDCTDHGQTIMHWHCNNGVCKQRHMTAEGANQCAQIALMYRIAIALETMSETQAKSAVKAEESMKMAMGSLNLLKMFNIGAGVKTDA